MRVIDCDCGQTLQAANEDDLVRCVQAHVEKEHEGGRMDEDEARELVAESSYNATDS